MGKLCLLLALILPVLASANDMPESVGIPGSGQTSVAVTSTAAQALAANAARDYLLIQNIGANPATCRFNGTFVGNEGIVIAANASFSPLPAVVGSVWCKSALGTTLNFTEGQK